MQIPAIKAAKKNSYRVYVADANVDAPAVSLADEFCHIDLKDAEALAEKAVMLKKEQNLAGVFTAGTDFSASVAYAASAAELPCIEYSTAMKASNKFLMRKTFQDACVPSPKFCSVKNASEAFKACSEIGVPVVIKPVDSMGARGVVKIEDLEDKEAINRAVENAIASSRSSEAIVEEFMDGPEFSLDAIVFNGEITICGFADRHIFFPPYFIEMGHTMPTEYNEEIKSAVIDVFKSGIKALGITMGAAKGDIKYSHAKGAMVGEIAARLSGGFMSGWTFPYSSGVNLTESAVKIACGKSPGSLSPSLDNVSAERAALSIPGIISSIEGIGEAERVDYVKDVFIHKREGERVVFPENNVQKCTNVITAASDRQLAVSSAEDAVRKIFFRLVPGDSATSDFIYRKTYTWAPDAFVLAMPSNLAAVIKMGASGCGMLPELDRELSVDWHGMKMKDAFFRLSQLVECSEKDFTADFWKAFLRGGLQAGVWFIETKRLGKL